MRKLTAALSVAAFVVALGAPAFAKEETVKGQIVDQTCYAKNKANTGATHDMGGKQVEDCAAACAKKGAPMALLTSDGKVYQITGDLAANQNEKIVPHISHTVEISGDVTSKDGKMMIASNSLKMISK
jgi:predicted lipoprotein with Yx(FWY)xxD motif